MIQSGSMEMVMLKNVLCARCDKRIPVDSHGFAMLDCECMYEVRIANRQEPGRDRESLGESRVYGVDNRQAG